MKMVATNVRHADDFLGDLRAMIGSARVGERRVCELLEEYGAETVLQSMDEILDSAEREARACIADMERRRLPRRGGARMTTDKVTEDVISARQ